MMFWLWLRLLLSLLPNLLAAESLQYSFDRSLAVDYWSYHRRPSVSYSAATVLGPKCSIRLSVELAAG